MMVEGTLKKVLLTIEKEKRTTIIQENLPRIS